jgi:hypothetical protein
MHHKLDPHIFIDQPLHLARSRENDFRVMVAGHAAGRIFATLRSSGRNVWLWTVTGPYLPGAGLNGSGDSDDLAAAKSAFRATFDAWLQWAIRQNAPVTWHE